MKMSTSRPMSELRMANAARSALKRANTAARRRTRLEIDEQAARAELDRLHQETCERFGRPFPRDALLIDVLSMIDIEDGDVWVWRGVRNNKDLATLRVHTSRTVACERSVVRYLAIALGVIDEDENGLLYPGETGTEDVNPFHRRLRASDGPIGNPHRFGF